MFEYSLQYYLKNILLEQDIRNPKFLSIEEYPEFKGLSRYTEVLEISTSEIYLLTHVHRELLKIYDSVEMALFADNIKWKYILLIHCGDKIDGNKKET